MCEYCRTTPHHPRCPLADKPQTDINCSCCNEGIVLGDEYIEVDGNYYHLNCVEMLSTCELLNIFNCDVKIKEDFYG